MKKRFAAWALLVAAVSPQALWAAAGDSDSTRAAEAKAKAAWADKVTAYQFCAAQDKVAAQYRARVAAMGKSAPEPVATPPCIDPGPFVYTSDRGTQPREGSGAHSPAETAKRPPSSLAPDNAGKPLAK